MIIDKELKDEIEMVGVCHTQRALKLIVEHLERLE